MLLACIEPIPARSWMSKEVSNHDRDTSTLDTRRPEYPEDNQPGREPKTFKTKEILGQIGSKRTRSCSTSASLLWTSMCVEPESGRDAGAQCNNWRGA